MAEFNESFDNLFFYLNDDHTVRKCSAEEWSKQFEEMSEAGNRHIRLDHINGKCISTVWLGNNMNFFGAKPLLFETMIFDGDSWMDEYCERYSSWDEAVEGHKKACELVKHGLKEE